MNITEEYFKYDLKNVDKINETSFTVNCESELFVKLDNEWHVSRIFKIFGDFRTKSFFIRCGFKSSTIRMEQKNFLKNQFSKFPRKASATLWIPPTSITSSTHSVNTRIFQSQKNVQSSQENSKSKIGSLIWENIVQWQKLECIELICSSLKITRTVTSPNLESECSARLERRNNWWNSARKTENVQFIDASLRKATSNKIYFKWQTKIEKIQKLTDNVQVKPPSKAQLLLSLIFERLSSFNISD